MEQSIAHPGEKNGQAEKASLLQPREFKTIILARWRSSTQTTFPLMGLTLIAVYKMLRAAISIAGNGQGVLEDS